MTTQLRDQLLEENERLRQEIDDLRRRLAEAEETIGAIRAGEIDAVLVGGEEQTVYTLETADHRYRLLVEQMIEGAATLTVDGKILYCNRRFAERLNRPIPTLIGQCFASYATPTSRPALDALLRDGQAGNAEGEVALQRADGAPVPLHLSVSALREGAMGLCLIVTDLTEQRHFQELQRTQEAQARLVAIVQSSDDAIVSKDLNGIITSWNRGAERLFGYTPQEAIGQSVTILMPPERVNEEPRILERIRRGESVEHYETVRRRKDGTLRDISLTVSPVRDAQGRIVGASKIARDITERKRSETLLTEQKKLLELIATGRPLGDCFSALTDAVSRLHPDARAAVLLADQARAKVACVIATAIPPAFGQGIEGLPINDSAIGTCSAAIYTGEPVTCADVAKSDCWSKPWRDLCLAYGIYACHSTPVLSVEGKAIASFVICFGTARDPDAWERRLGEFGARIASIAMERDRITNALAAELSAMQRLHALSVRLMHHAGDLETMMHEVLVAACELVQADKCSAQVRDRQSGTLNLLTGIGFDREFFNRFHLITERDVTTCAAALRRSERILVEDLAADPQYAEFARLAASYNLRAALSIPQFGSDGTLLGVFTTYWQRPHRPSEHELRFLELYAQQAARYIERTHAEDALRESERRFRDMIDALPAPVYTTDAQGTLTHFNPAAVALCGRTPKLGSDRWCVNWKLYQPDGTPLPHDTCPMAITLQEGRALRGAEVIAERPDGARRWLEVYPTPMRDSEGQIIGGINMFVDITERKFAEKALRESEERFRQVANTMPQIVWTARPDGSIDYFNERWYEYTGFARDQFDQASWEAILHPDDVQRCVATYFDCIRTEKPYQIEYRFKDRRTGGYRWFLGRALPVRDDAGRVTRWFGTSTDIDVTKKAGERLRLLWEAAAVLFTTDNPDVLLRELFAKIGPHLGLDIYFNYLVEDTGDALRLASYLGIPEPTARSIARLEFGQAMCGTVALQRRPLQVTHIQQSDDPKAQLVKSFGIRAYACNPLLSGGELIGTLSFASCTRDQFEPDELTFLGTICHYVTVAYERLRLLNELKEADRRKDEFLATLAHELRNPLAPVRNAMQLLRLKGSDQPEIRWSRDVVDRQVTHLTRLIDDLLDVSRITRNKLELRKQRLELAEVINGAVETSRPLIDQCGHELTVSLPSQPVYLYADLVRLAQVFMNLLTNAAKYTERGGRIWLTVDQQGREVVVRVKDTGVGIPAEKLPRLFELFFQVDRSLERSQGGLGIGLSLVRRLVELHGGTVKAYSAGSGKGAEFTVRLPVLADPPASAPPPAGDGEKKATPSYRILVVDDIRDSAESLAMLLQLMGNTVETAHDGLAALEAAERFRPDVVLLDIGMPKLNGYDTCHRIREQPWGRRIVLIALTGWGTEEDKRRTEEAGFNAHLVKPVDPAALHTLLTGLVK